MPQVQLKELRIQVQGLLVNYKTIGLGTPILILPGWGGSSETWKSFIDYFKASDKYQLIVLDLPGFGKSDDPPVAWSVSDYVNFVLDFTEKIDLERFVLVGHSFGGRVSIKLTARYQQKVEALVLVAAAGIKHKKSLKQRTGNLLAKQGKKIFSLPFFKKYFHFSRKALYKLLRERDYVKTRGNMKETFQRVVAEDLTPYLNDIKVPTLIIWGTKDRMTPVNDAYVMNDGISGSVLEVIEGGGHGLHKEMPKRLNNTILHFISRP
ncbi:alpha/beta hydrolase [Patescibacteria group bacterium]|nr:alpha/beta hydrolase [Patescibacteria group bacterium]